VQSASPFVRDLGRDVAERGGPSSTRHSLASETTSPAAPRSGTVRRSRCSGRSEGLGTCWVCHFHETPLQELLGRTEASAFDPEREALLLPKDAHHSRAVQAIEDFDRSRLSDVLLTTNSTFAARNGIVKSRE
jgi:hypothetical protein